MVDAFDTVQFAFEQGLAAAVASAGAAGGMAGLAGEGGMVAKSGEVCKFFLRGMCNKGAECPFRHVRTEKNVVCKHWLKGMCKKGDLCEFLHVWDPTKVPECRYFARFGTCNRPDCPYLHVPPEEKAKECPWFNRGFCKHGARCHHRHVRDKPLCEDYMNGFCPKGPDCPFAHPKWEAPREESATVAGPGRFSNAPRQMMLCFKCGMPGHKAANCPTPTIVTGAPRMPVGLANPLILQPPMPFPTLPQTQPHW